MLILTMAGEGQRFRKEGYQNIKYLLKFGNKPILFYILKSYKTYIEANGVIMVFQQADCSKERLFEITDEVGLPRCKVNLHGLQCNTLGQAHTAAIALKMFEVNNNFIIANIDTLIWDWPVPDKKLFLKFDGGVDVTDWPGNNWSFVVPKDNLEISTIVEKKKVSDLTSVGLYYFTSTRSFINTFEAIINSRKMWLCNDEIYVSEVIALMIDQGRRFQYRVLEKNQIDLFGTPAEYKTSCKKYGFYYDRND